MHAMTNPYLVLVECRHGGSPTGEDCHACEGSGYVKVVVGLDGRPKACQHAANQGNLEDCEACFGSGWAGISE